MIDFSILRMKVRLQTMTFEAKRNMELTAKVVFENEGKNGNPPIYRDPLFRNTSWSCDRTD